MAAAATPAPGGYIPYNAPLPGGASAEQGALLANTAYQKALATLNARRQSTLRQYGYAGDVNAQTGVVENIRVDPFNPYGSFQTLLRNSAIQGDQARNAAEGRGLHGGLAHQLERNVQYEHGAQSQALGTALTQSLADFQTQQEQADVERNQALYQALLDNARTAISNGDTNPAPDTTVPNTTTTSTSTDTGGTDPNDAFVKWLTGQSAAAGMYRTNKPRGIRGTYVN